MRQGARFQQIQGAGAAVAGKIVR